MRQHKVPLLPPGVLRYIELRFQEAAGILLLCLTGYMLNALLHYSPLDASWNTASATMYNCTGAFGAILADWFYQWFNVISWPILLTLGIYSVQIFLHRYPILTLKRCIVLLAAIFLGCIVAQSLKGDEVSNLAALPALPSGGIIGFLAARKIYHLLQAFHATHWFWPIVSVCSLTAIICWKYSVNITFRQVYHTVQHMCAECYTLYQKMKTLRQIPSAQASLFKTDNAVAEENIENIFPIGNAPTETSKTNRRRKRTKTTAPLATHNEGYQTPPLDLLKQVKEQDTEVSKEVLADLSAQLLNVLSEFGIQGEIEDVKPGPVVTMYAFRPAPGIKTSRVISLSDDIARSMSALSARIATIPGHNAIGIELPNQKRQTVYLRPLLATTHYRNMTAGLPLILGKDISGRPVISDLVKMPHLLVAGTTGSGKSVSINTMILSLLYRFSPSQCKFIMVDPKMLELSVYNDIPHLLTPVVTEPKKAIFALKWAVREMENRYRAMSRLGVRNIDGFNQRIREGHQKGDVFMRRVQTGFDPETGKPIFEDQPLDYKELPYIVIVVDEMADLMLVAGKEIEAAVQRLAQMARAAGLHLIMATQRPSVDVITGTIKANFPTRISFQVTSKIDSRTILGEQGAEHLLGHGDMLFMSGGGRVQRVHGPFVSDAEVERVTEFLKSQGEPDYIDGITDEADEEDNAAEPEGRDDLFAQAVDLVREEGRVSISYIQRRFQIGYNKAARLVEQMEKAGVVSPPDRSGKRELL